MSLPAPITALMKLWKYGETLADATPHWYEITGHANVTGFVEGATSYLIVLEDGGFGDADLTVNGVIVDPLGIARCAPETCDGADNDCDGQIDESTCDDGNPCTDDVCDPAAGCSNPPNTATCDDGNACTTGDVCVAGTCTGTDRPATACDDGNPCTDDSCLAQTGCAHADNTATCDDGDACTTGDACAGGACSGEAIDCDDGDACTLDSCDPPTGQCGHESKTCDKDSDGDGTPDEQDCAPDDKTVHPKATEACNQRDDDCDGEIDENLGCDTEAEESSGCTASTGTNGRGSAPLVLLALFAIALGALRRRAAILPAP